jgi:hypothetical protein
MDFATFATYDLSNITDQDNILGGCGFNEPLNNFADSNITNYAYAFNGNSFNQSVDPIDWENVTGAYRMLGGWHNVAYKFDQSLENIRLRKTGVDLRGMLDYTPMSVYNYSRTLISWANYVYDNMQVNPSEGPINVSFGAIGLVYNDINYEDYISGVFTNAATASNFLTSQLVDSGAAWTINGHSPDGFIGGLQLQLDIPDSGVTVELPLYGTVDVQVDWNDDTAYTAQVGSGDCSHTYDDSGTYYIRISGEVTQFGDGAPWSGVEYLTRVYNL